MMFKEGSKLYATEIERKQGETSLYVNYLSASFVPSIANNPSDMARAIDLLVENPGVAQIIFVQQRNYLYSTEQVLMLGEIAGVYAFLTKQEALLSLPRLSLYGEPSEVHHDLTYLLLLLRQDPLLCFSELKRRIAGFRAQVSSESVLSGTRANYVRLLERFVELLSQTRLVRFVEREVETMDAAFGREVYHRIFRPDTMPNFTFTRLVAQVPADAQLIDQYEIESEHEKASIMILQRQDDTKYLYHVSPPEYALSEEHHILLQLSRTVLLEHRPKSEEFTDPEKTRHVFFNIARDLLRDLAQSKNISLNYRELQSLARILVRYTIGYGLLEILLLDSKLQDIVLNAPVAQNPVFVRHEKYDECVTNIIPSYEDAESWAAKLRLQSGRALDEANPVLDTDLVFGTIRARVAAIKEPLSPAGLAYALRRHRDQPWTLPLFVQRKMLNSFAAGLLSFFVDTGRAIIIAGTRSSGKTSLLGSFLLNILPNHRIITVEDTLELPVDALRVLGYDILRMKVRSALTSGTTEVEASEGIRTSLRLGDSALIVGEIRSTEAKALYEAMRVGASANVVAGTIHGDSPYGVFDRVVNDLGVPPTSFKATDIVVIVNPVKTPDGLHAVRRVMQITEVRKHWTRDPMEEGGFVDLMLYNVEKDELEPTPELINGSSEIIKNIAGNVKGWAGNWDAVYDNIILRGLLHQALVDISMRLQKPALLEAKFVMLANTAFHRISDEVRKTRRLPLQEYVLPLWSQWLHNAAERF